MREREAAALSAPPSQLFPKVLKLVGMQELEDLAVVMQDTAEELEQGEPRESVPLETGAPSSIE